MHLSYWELKNYFSGIDFTIVGSGIVGLHAALRLRERFPKSKILVLEKGFLPQGASTKNAGFACFGSLSEIIDDLNFHSEQQVIDLIQKRRDGLALLRKNLGDAAIGFEVFGGYELFLAGDEWFEKCIEKLPFVNDLLRPLFGADVFSPTVDSFGFRKINKKLLYNPFEAQLDTGNMMQALLKKAIGNDILILNRQTVVSSHESDGFVEVALDGFSFKTDKLLYATNGFAAAITNNRVKPARAQVLITKPIPNLNIKGTFHLDCGYYYFRNVGDRILFGGGRNLDFETEGTTEFGQTEIIQNRLGKILKEVILPGREFEIEHRWSGIMGMGTEKLPIVEQLTERTYCGVRLGGMGVAIGSLVGKQLADLV